MKVAGRMGHNKKIKLIRLWMLMTARDVGCTCHLANFSFVDGVFSHGVFLNNQAVVGCQVMRAASTTSTESFGTKLRKEGDSVTPGHFRGG